MTGKNLGCLEKTLGRNMEVQGSGAKGSKGNEELVIGNWGKQVFNNSCRKFS